LVLCNINKKAWNWEIGRKRYITTGNCYIYHMQTHTFKKEMDQWFIDLPAYIAGGGDKGDLQMVAGADTMLDVMAAGKDQVTIAMDTSPFNGADELILLEHCDPILGGGFYLMPSFEDKKVDQQMWLCAVTEFVFGYMPEKIFVKRVVTDQHNPA
jgi:hypothetical protein